MYYNQIAAPIWEKLNNIKPPVQFRDLIEYLLVSTVEHHVVSRRAHDEMARLVNTEEDFGQLHRRLQFKTADSIVAFFHTFDFNVNNAHEKLHFFLQIADIYSHEVVYQKTEGFDYAKIKDAVVSFMLYMMME